MWALPTSGVPPSPLGAVTGACETDRHMAWSLCNLVALVEDDECTLTSRVFLFGHLW